MAYYSTDRAKVEELDKTDFATLRSMFQMDESLEKNELIDHIMALPPFNPPDVDPLAELSVDSSGTDAQVTRG
jgi:hypothetical protein